jgi:hypothetical protein
MPVVTLEAGDSELEASYSNGASNLVVSNKGDIAGDKSEELGDDVDECPLESPAGGICRLVWTISVRALLERMRFNSRGLTFLI